MIKRRNSIRNRHRIRLDSYELKMIVNGLAGIRDRNIEGATAEEIDDLILRIIHAGERASIR